MARLARVVLPNVPHHVTQRGNRRQTVFFSDADYAEYRGLVATYAARAGTTILAYCLMPNHVHFVMVPTSEDGLRAALAEAHRRYTRAINLRQDCQGHLWQERFHSYPMDESHLLQAMRYVELNPVRAGLVEDPAAWQWSSAAAHLHGKSDPLVDPADVKTIVDDWAAYMTDGLPADEVEMLERHLRTGRPLADDKFLQKAEKLLNRPLRRGRPGRKAQPSTTAE